MLKCVIFDLDGVLVSTDESHFQAWNHLAKKYNIPFTREDNMRQRGVSRMESLEVLLENADREFSAKEKEQMAAEKNEIYCLSLEGLSAENILPGVVKTLDFLENRGIQIAVGSSSKNAPLILEKTGLRSRMNVVVCGNDIQHSKPHPEVFAKAGEQAGVLPQECLVVEDADTGVEAGKAADMRVLAVGAAKNNPKADFYASSLADENFSLQRILDSFASNTSQEGV